jgi:serine phosphatase RsbU (regulator of sigma subunit)
MDENGTAADPSFDRYARMVTRYLDVPIALVSIVEPDRQVFPGADGLPPELDEIRETPLSHSFCQYVVMDEAPMIVTDARQDERLRDNPAIPDLGVIAYAGWPLIDADGVTIGSLCAIDDRPRDWTREDLDALADLADACSAEMMYRHGKLTAEADAQRARDLSQRSRVLLALSEGLSVTRTLDDIAYAVERVAVENLGCLHAGLWLRKQAAPGSGDADLLHYVSDPAAKWSSAARNGQLAIDDSNPLGETLSRGKPLYFVRRNDQNLRYPDLDLSEQVGEARVFVPLALGQVFGTMALLWSDERTVSAEERVTITTLASYVSQALQRALLLKEREDASLTLQSAMLTRLPKADGMDLTARYRPAAVHDRVGGDWYDAVLTPTGETNLMIGDVSGHDMSAAAVMGELRSMLRAFAWAHEDCPASNVRRLDEAMASFGMDRFASLVYARVEQPDGSGGRTVHWTNAGHFPPLLVHADGSTELLEDDGGADLLIGIDASVPRHNQTARIPDGSLLLLYTDGLIERRGESIDDGLDRLRVAASRRRAMSPGHFLDGVVEELVGGTHEDDVAVLAVRFA